MEDMQGPVSQIQCVWEDTKATLFSWQENDAKGLAMSHSSPHVKLNLLSLEEEGPSSLHVAMWSRRLMIMYKNSLGSALEKYVFELKEKSPNLSSKHRNLWAISNCWLAKSLLSWQSSHSSVAGLAATLAVQGEQCDGRGRAVSAALSSLTGAIPSPRAPECLRRAGHHLCPPTPQGGKVAHLIFQPVSRLAGCWIFPLISLSH